ncbi:palmitoyltransferase [Nematocida displodere]|uniref:Palmitoyltransferase n=1 Tax=Nematocida displodere TaxID=1805483 RepID=A0A177EJ02_9MICR|nr:palmitoyltransferase [Nematocida displodere]
MESVKAFIREFASVWQRLVFTAVAIYLFFVYNTIYSIRALSLLSIPLLVLFAIFQALVLLVGFCYFRMVIAKNCTTLELFPDLEEQGHESSSESLHLNPFEEENLTTQEKSVNICLICKTTKPPRSYHCIDCNRCLLMMYKHSRWFDVCIGFTNYKFYVVLLFYSGLLCSLSIGSFIYGLATMFGRLWVFIPVLIALVLQSFMALVIVWEMYQAITCILENKTLEERKDPTMDKNITYDLGRKENWRMIMGDTWYLWFLPVWSTSGNGLKYTINRKTLDQSSQGDE